MMILMREILQLKLYVSQPRFVLLLLVCFLLVEGCRASQNSSNGSNSVIPPDTIVTQLQITPATSSLPVGFGEHLKAEVTLSDSTTLDVTADDAISWSSSNPAIATISGSGVNKGMLTGVAAGTVTITASGEANGQVFSSTAEVTVEPFLTVSNVGSFSIPDVVRLNWEDADAYCNALATAGGGWRLPSLDELVALYDAYQNPLGWPAYSAYWTSAVFNENSHYIVSLLNGGAFGSFNSNHNHSTCIR
ncbi:Ig-like domain-containing protein [Aeromonas hydrophila]|uniref:Ig-like domain-containing protein n=2 Tax=Aeromonas hydrophila TaxID=644 RepID=UPI00159F31F6|nr:Ig-like domain-containing protein [Aeromonas hydrophila]